MRRSNKSDSSLAIAILFIAFIGLLLLAGVLLKVFLLVKASTFDGSHQYIVEVDENAQKGMLIAYNPSTPSVVSILVSGSHNSSLGTVLSVPVDAKVSMPVNTDIPTLTRDMLFHATSSLTIFDKLRLFFFVNSLKQTAFTQKNLTLPVDATVTDKLIPSLFLDNTLYFDNESVTVINATGVSGVGTDVAHLLTTIGINVISVITATNDQESTTFIAYQPSTYTVKRIQRITHVTPTLATDPAHLSDITLTIGKNSLSLLQ